MYRTLDGPSVTHVVNDGLLLCDQPVCLLLPVVLSFLARRWRRWFDGCISLPWRHCKKLLVCLAFLPHAIGCVDAFATYIPTSFLAIHPTMLHFAMLLHLRHSAGHLRTLLIVNARRTPKTSYSNGQHITWWIIWVWECDICWGHRYVGYGFDKPDNVRSLLFCDASMARRDLHVAIDLVWRDGEPTCSTNDDMVLRCVPKMTVEMVHRRWRLGHVCKTIFALPGLLARLIRISRNARMPYVPVSRSRGDVYETVPLR